VLLDEKIVTKKEMWTVEEINMRRQSEPGSREFDAFVWLTEKAFPCVAGKKEWGRHCHKVCIRDIDATTERPWVSTSDEALVLLLLENNMEKWTDEHKSPGSRYVCK